VWWEGRATQPIVRIELFREAAFAIVNLASASMYLVTFSVLLFAPYFLVRYTGCRCRSPARLLATGFVAWRRSRRWPARWSDGSGPNASRRWAR
jgi:hypothetical protein